MKEIQGKEIDNPNVRKANATKDNVYTIHVIKIHTNKYVKHDPRQPTTTSDSDKVLEKART